MCTKQPCSKQFSSVEARKNMRSYMELQSSHVLIVAKDSYIKVNFFFTLWYTLKHKSFMCPYPDYDRKYKMDPEYRRHIKAHRNPPSEVHCEIKGCHFDGDQKGLMQHILGYGPTTMPCGFCPAMLHFHSQKVMYGYRI